MDSDDSGRADHGPYVAAVRRQLEARGIRVSDIRVSRRDGRRATALLVALADADSTGAGACDASLYWDEEDGWSLRARPDAGDLSSAAPVYKGLSVVPEPADVAARVLVLLAHPELTPSREDHPFRAHLMQDQGFEELLARYSPAC
ncbi:MAG TPA: DUF6292 family protein [Streptosporangiaceae bacterium]|jgi:hypothetical protein